MPRSHQQIADENGETLTTIKELSRAGVNVYDDEELTHAIKNKRHRIKPGAEIPGDDLPDEDLQTLSDLKTLLLTTRDIDTAKIVKEKADAFKKLIAAEKEEGLVLSRREVEERETRIGSACKAAFDKMGNELPGSCAGLDEVGILKVYERLKREALTMLADLTSEFWKEKK